MSDIAWCLPQNYDVKKPPFLCEFSLSESSSNPGQLKIKRKMKRRKWIFTSPSPSERSAKWGTQSRDSRYRCTSLWNGRWERGGRRRFNTNDWLADDRRCGWLSTRTTPAGRTTPPGPRERILRRLRWKIFPTFLSLFTSSSQTIKSLWKPNLEIYGLEDFQTHQILGEMAGLRITNKKIIKYDMK